MKKIVLIFSLLLIAGVNCGYAQIINTFAGTPSTPGYFGDGGAATAAQLSYPSGIAMDKYKNMYIADLTNQVVRKVDSNGNITTFAGNGTGGYTGDNGPATAAELNSPISVAVDTAGNVYIADESNLVIRMVNTNDSIFTVAGNGTAGFAASYSGPATSVSFAGVYGVAADKIGNFYLTDGNGAVFKVVKSTGTISLWGGGSGLGYAGDGGPATAAVVAFNGTAGICTDSYNNLYIADQWNNVIRMINANDSVFTVVGNGFGAGAGSPFGGAGAEAGDGGPATAAELNAPNGVYVDACGDIFISDYFNAVIRYVEGSTDIISLIAGTTGTFGYFGDGVPATAALLSSPYDVTGDQSGNYYIADYGNNIVRGVVTTTSISINALPGTTACSTGSSTTAITFSNTYSTSACAPSFKWLLNGATVSTASTYTDATPVNGDIVVCQLINGGAVIATSAPDTITVLADVTPSVTVTASPSYTVCPGTVVSYTATGTDTGTAPIYNWYVNSVYQASGNTYSYTPAGGDVVTCQLVSSYPCVITGTVTSTPITMVATTAVTPVITISSVYGDTICNSTSDTFNSVVTYGGTLPAYQWQVNGVNIGTGADTLEYTPVPGDNITCILTSNAACVSTVTVTSNDLAMDVTTPAPPTDSIRTVGSDTVCTGAVVTFTVVETSRGGTAPTFYWYVNGVLVYVGTPFSYSPADADHVVCVMHSNSNCVSIDTSISNNIKMNVNPAAVPTDTIGITSGHDTVCAGTPVSFGITSAVNAGPTPTYLWYVNSIYHSTGSTLTYAPANLDTVTCKMISSASCVFPDTVKSNGIVMYVNPTIVPSVAVAYSPGDTVCNGTEVSFTVTPTNGGTSPALLWYKNGTFEGSGATYSYYPANGDIITSVLISNVACASPDTVTSAPITMVVNPEVAPSATITVTPGTSVCVGTLLTFTVVATNGGSAPVYTWNKNGIFVGTGSSYSYTPSGSDNIICKVLSNAMCAVPDSAISNDITIHALPYLTPSVSVVDSPGSSICAGTEVTYSATAVDGGVAPSFTWVINGITRGSGPTISYVPLPGDVIYAEVTSSYACPSVDTAVSSTITMVVSALVTPSLTVTANPGDTVCLGLVDSFYTTIANGGSTPTFSWLINGAYITNTAEYGYVPTNGDTVTVILTSNAACTTVDTVEKKIGIVVNTPAIPTVSLGARPGTTLCSGAVDTIIATTTYGGTAPLFQWYVNGTYITFDSSSSFIYTPANGDIIYCTFASNANCIATDSASSTDMTITVDAFVTPTDSFTIFPGDTVCIGEPVILHGYSTYGGTSPVYKWVVDGVTIGTGASYTFTPTNGDTVSLVMVSDHSCISRDSAVTSSVDLTVDSLPVMSITASPDTAISSGDTVHFTATVSGNSTILYYQWFINGAPVSGANGSNFVTSNFTNNDTVTCEVISSTPCIDTIVSNSEIIINVGVPLLALNGDELNVVPNPSKGGFVVSGTINIKSDLDMTFDVTDMVGQSVYKQTTTIANGKVNVPISLGSELADGVYLLHISSNGYQQIVHLVIEK